MWLTTTFGFFSVCHKPEDPPGLLTVRARVRSDLEALRDRYLPLLGEIARLPEADYRYHAKAARDEVAAALAKIALDLDYPNFKDAVFRSQGWGREQVYARVWSTLLELRRDDDEEPVKLARRRPPKRTKL